MRRVNIYLTDKQDDNLDYLSEILDGKSRSDIVREAIDQYTENYKSEINNFLAGVIDVTKETPFLREYENNPVSFIEDNMQIHSLDGIIPFKLYDAQKKLTNTLHNYNEVIINKSRQTGTSNTILGYIIHYIVFNENKNIFIGTPKYAHSSELLDNLVQLLDSLPSHIRPVIKDKTKSSFICNGNRIVSRACHFEHTNSARFDFIYLDEFSWVQRHVADDFMAAVFPTIASSDHPYKFIIASTPKDCNHFYKLWTDAISNHNNFRPVKITYNNIPGRDGEWAKKLIRDIGQERFDQEFRCHFLKEDNIAI